MASSTRSAWRHTAEPVRPSAKFAQAATGMLPDAVAQKLIENVGVDRLTALHNAIGAVRRGGTVSISGVYGGTADPMPMMDLFDKQVQLRMGQCNVKKWISDILPLVDDPSDPLGVLDLTTHTVPDRRSTRCLPHVPAEVRWMHQGRAQALAELDRQATGDF